MTTNTLIKELEIMSVKQLQVFYNDTTKTKNVVFNSKNKRTALAKCVALIGKTVEAKAKPVKATKTVKKEKVVKEKRETVSAFIYERIDAGMSSDDILIDVKKAFPESKSTSKDISWLKWKRKQVKK